MEMGMPFAPHNPQLPRHCRMLDVIRWAKKQDRTSILVCGRRLEVVSLMLHNSSKKARDIFHTLARTISHSQQRGLLFHTLQSQRAFATTTRMPDKKPITAYPWDMPAQVSARCRLP